MPEPIGRGTTNDTPGSVVEVEADCSVLWSAAHQFSYLRLSEELEDDSQTLEVDLLDSYYARARRIAATYARIYLEQEEGGDKDKKGRFYWMALGAFAAKTVACLLDKWQIKASYNAGEVVDSLSPTPDLNIISEGLGLGNFWLFMDVSVWHWLYTNYPGHFFEGMSCSEKRDALQLLKVPKEVVTENLQWAKYALPRINYLRPTKYITEGMQLLTKIEESSNELEQVELKMDHLKAIANHEQLMILQKLIYDHKDFAFWLKQQRNRWLLKLIAPKYELVFTSGCETEDAALKSMAPDGVELEVAGSLDDGAESRTRMGWIGEAAELFHLLMSKSETHQFLEQELNTIASWVDQPDDPGNWTHNSSFK